MRTLSLCLLSLYSFSVEAQSTPSLLTSTLVDAAAKNPLEGVTVNLRHFSDSALVKTVLSDRAGRFSFSNLAEGKYFFAASVTGYSIYATEVDVHNGKNRFGYH